MMAKKIIKAVIFLLIFVIGFNSIQSVLAETDERGYKSIHGFFDERENSLDAVFLGSSATYAFWNAPAAFAEHGITVYSMTNASQPTFAAKYIMKDALKTQPDALYIINITHYLSSYDSQLHHLTVNYPNTINKPFMTHYLCEMGDLSFSQRMEQYFPIIRFHDRWNELTKDDFFPPKDEYKCGSVYSAFLTKSKDVGDIKYDFEVKAKLSEDIRRGLTDIMDFCEKEQVKVLFVVVPQGVNSKQRNGRQNSSIEMLQERGFDVLDLRRHVDEIGIDFSKDYYNEKHTNLHGSLKITDFMSRYLIENYGFEDKRGREEYSDWTQASLAYYKEVFDHFEARDVKYLQSLL